MEERADVHEMRSGDSIAGVYYAGKRRGNCENQAGQKHVSEPLRIGRPCGHARHAIVLSRFLAQLACNFGR